MNSLSVKSRPAEEQFKQVPQQGGINVPSVCTAALTLIQHCVSISRAISVSLAHSPHHAHTDSGLSLTQVMESLDPDSDGKIQVSDLRRLISELDLRDEEGNDEDSYSEAPPPPPAAV